MRSFSLVCLLCMCTLYGQQGIKYRPTQPSKRNIITIAVAATNPNTPRTNQSSPINQLAPISPIHDLTHIPVEYHENLHDLIPESKHATTPPTKTRSIIDTRRSFSHKAYMDKKNEDKKSSSCCSLQ